MDINVEQRNNLEPQYAGVITNGGESRIRTIRSIVRRCSFCGMNGHRVNNCSDERLREFETECIVKINILSSDNTGINYKINQFKLWLMERYCVFPNTVKTFGITKCGYVARGHDIEECFNLITRYFYGLEEETREEETEDFLGFPDVLVNVDNVEDIMNYYNRNLEQEQNNNYERIISNIKFDFNDFKNDFKNDFNNNNNSNFECNICYETYDIKEFVKLNCNHSFCKDCIKNTIKTTTNINSVRCALCREVVNEIKVNCAETYCLLFNK